MEETREIRDGTTSPITIQLLSDGSPLAISSAYQVIWKMVDSKNQVYTYSNLDNPARITVSLTSTGVVILTPASSNIFSYVRSPYDIYCWVYPDPANIGQKYAVPEGNFAIINVIKDY